MGGRGGSDEVNLGGEVLAWVSALSRGPRAGDAEWQKQ
jgi:hypothetical protein